MIRWISAGLFLLLVILPMTVSGQGFTDSAPVDTITVKAYSSNLVLPARYYHTNINFDLSAIEVPHKPNLSGYEVYRLSRMRCTIKGAGMGATAGFMAGAFGEMAGAWDEKSCWYIAGAMAAFGALYGGGVKADDKEWNLQIRLEPERGDRFNSP